MINNKRKNKISDSDIAIIGMSCRFPGAKNIDEFWNNLKEGKESITFFSDEDLMISDQDVLNDPNYVKAGAILSDVDQFDADFFGFSAHEAKILDPQHRKFLECSWEALEDSGYNTSRFEGSIGVFAGSGMNTYLINNIHPNIGYHPNRTFLSSMNDLQLMTANDRDYLATRVSYKLDLRGPSINIQTACSTSLVAVHSACQSILNGECEMALAGAVTIITPQKSGYLYQEDMIFSPDGHCRAFDEKAQGTVFGSGVGVIVLKKLSEALEDGDTIHAVIKGTAVNNDGAMKIGYSAPSVNGQVAVISEALAVADIEPEQITYIETHGTATPLGDPIEISALNQVFGGNKKRSCAIGSVKTNIGHLSWAAGMAGLIKSVLSLKHRQIPPSLYFNKANPRIDFENSPFYVNTTLSEWKSEKQRLAGVSAFGLGGTNAHIILEEAPTILINENDILRKENLLSLSAKNPAALKTLVDKYFYFIEKNKNLNISDLCYTTNIGRRHFDSRIALIASSLKELHIKLNDTAISLEEDYQGETNKFKSSPVAFLFTGQGSQFTGMGRELYETEKVFRDTFNECNKIAHRYLYRSLIDLIYNNNKENILINKTSYTQPVLFAFEYALAKLWMSWGVKPDVVIGHSLGEYVAACIAGVFTLEDGVRLVIERGRLIQSLPQDGQMIIVFANEEKVRSVINDYQS